MDKVVYSRILLCCDDFTTFSTLAKTCKCIYKVAKIVWREWFITRFKHLGSFVDFNDSFKLLNIMVKIQDETLIDTVSILQIFGGYSSGKSTLVNIFQKINPRYGDCYTLDSMVDTRYFIGFKNSTVFLKDDFIEARGPEKMSRDLDWWNLRINKGFNARKPYHSQFRLENPGVLVVTLNEKHEFKRRMKRNPISIRLPNTFKYSESSIVEKCVEEFKIHG